MSSADLLLFVTLITKLRSLSNRVDGEYQHRQPRRPQVGCGNCVDQLLAESRSAVRCCHELRCAFAFTDDRVPFGGMKHSGIGREGGEFSLDFFTEKKTICVQYGQ